ncbi:MAG: non-canonical purine NTP pyrophosphatase [Candidatus Sericytochromatia bacterium]|nr:non-canonical purine NTP pyrophosphatase [Candidatus Tanganyikabacteria bacterium]
MPLFFVTGNAGKFEEVRSFVAGVEQWDVDLPEIQEMDARAIIAEKLAEARRHREGTFIVEDTSLYLSCLRGLPGPLIKWFLQCLGDEGLSDLAARLGDDRAEARIYFGLASPAGGVAYYEGAVAGRIVKPRGTRGFGWDRLFQPDGSDLTFGEMDADAKQAFSMRRKALDALLAAHPGLSRS